jgi:hypothetical protein
MSGGKYHKTYFKGMVVSYTILILYWLYNDKDESDLVSIAGDATHLCIVKTNLCLSTPKNLRIFRHFAPDKLLPNQCSASVVKPPEKNKVNHLERTESSYRPRRLPSSSVEGLSRIFLSSWYKPPRSLVQSLLASNHLEATAFREFYSSSADNVRFWVGGAFRKTPAPLSSASELATRQRGALH